MFNRLRAILPKGYPAPKPREEPPERRLLKARNARKVVEQYSSDRAVDR